MLETSQRPPQARESDGADETARSGATAAVPSQARQAVIAALRTKQVVRVMIAVGVGAVLLAVVVAQIYRAGHPTRAANVAAAKRFYAALAANDARAALAEAAAPTGDISLLTDGVLKAAHDAAPMGPVAVAVEGDTVVARYTLGGRTRADRLHFPSTDADAKIDNAFTSIAVSTVSSTAAPLVVAGVRPQQASAPLLPGRYPVTASSPNLTYGSGTIDAAPGTDTLGHEALPLAASAAGTTAFRAAARQSLQICVAVKSLAPPGCPFSYSPQANEQIDASTISWQVVGDPSGAATVAPGTDPTVAAATLPLTVRLSAKSKGTDISHDVDATGNAIADLTLTQPVVTWR